MGTDIILYDTRTITVHRTQIGLGNAPVRGSKGEPLHRSLIVLWNTVPFVVHHTQVGLGIGKSLFGRKSMKKLKLECRKVIF